MDRGLIITVDGPAGVGKSTVSRAVADRLSYVYLDTGALYRAIAWKADKAGISVDDETALEKMCGNIRISFQRSENGFCISVDDEDVTDAIREERVSSLASRVSAVAAVRSSLMPIQRDAGKAGRIVAEGRDMGTVVFPEADVKFFLDADIDERALRRHRQLAERGVGADMKDIRDDIVLRDRQDSERSLAPLRPAEDAIVIDTTVLGIRGVVARMMDLIDGASNRKRPAVRD